MRHLVFFPGPSSINSRHWPLGEASTIAWMGRGNLQVSHKQNTQAVCKPVLLAGPNPIPQWLQINIPRRPHHMAEDHELPLLLMIQSASLPETIKPHQKQITLFGSTFCRHAQCIEIHLFTCWPYWISPLYLCLGTGNTAPQKLSSVVKVAHFWHLI